jgi:subtilisin family serine protease
MLSIVGLSAHAETPEFDNSRLFIKLKSGEALPATKMIKSVKHLFADNYLVTTADAISLQNELKNHPSVLRTEKNYFAGKRNLPEISTVKEDNREFLFKAFNDPKVGRVWSFANATKNGVSVDKSYLSPLGTQKSDVIVAVVDTGVDYNHEDLKNVMWKNTLEIADNGVDDDNNGYIDDVFGIDTLTKDSDGNATGDPMASHAHGTHVSGTIAAEQNNNTGIAGIASQAKIMAIRTVPDSSDETDADVVESFLYAANHGAKLINCSFGKKHNEGGMIVNETIDHIGQNFGVLVFAAAGNDYGRNIDVRRAYPASFESDYLLVVASTAKNGGLSWFSNIGPKSVDLAAPGSDIYSTVPRNRYANMSGTSMATPTTVGVAAEVLSHFPELTPVQLKHVLMNSVTPVKKFEGKMVAAGRVDLFSALQYTLENYSQL